MSTLVLFGEFVLRVHNLHNVHHLGAGQLAAELCLDRL